MRYALLIYEAPGAYDGFSDDERRAVSGEYLALRDDPRVVDGARLKPVETAHHRPRGGRRGTDHGRPVRRHQGGLRRLLRARGGRPRRRLGDRGPDTGGSPRRIGRGASDGGAVALIEKAFRDSGVACWRRWSACSATSISPKRPPRRRLPPRQSAGHATARPRIPARWLVTTARNKAIDRLRRERTLAAKTRLLDVPEAVEDRVDETTIPDERLELIFTCCHPALATEAQVALTLRALGGLTTEEIAEAFLVAAETMKRRLSRAKTKIREGGDPLQRPARSRVARAPCGGAGGGLPHLQRGLRRPLRPGRRGDPAGASC